MWQYISDKLILFNEFKRSNYDNINDLTFNIPSFVIKCIEEKCLKWEHIKNIIEQQSNHNNLSIILNLIKYDPDGTPIEDLVNKYVYKKDQVIFQLIKYTQYPMLYIIYDENNKDIYEKYMFESLKNDPRSFYFVDSKYRLDYDFLINHPELIIHTRPKEINDYLLEMYFNSLTKKISTVNEYKNFNQHLPQVNVEDYVASKDVLLASLDHTFHYITSMGPTYVGFCKEVMLKAVKKYPLLYSYINKELNNDYELAEIAVSCHGSLLYFCSDILKDSKELVKKALLSSGKITDVSYLIVNEKNHNIVFSDITPLIYASKRLQQSIELFELSIKKYDIYDSLNMLSKKMRDTRNFMVKKRNYNDPYLVFHYNNKYYNIYKFIHVNDIKENEHDDYTNLYFGDYRFGEITYKESKNYRIHKLISRKIHAIVEYII